MRKLKERSLECALEAILFKSKLFYPAQKKFWPLVAANSVGQALFFNRVPCYGSFENKISDPVLFYKFQLEINKWNIQKEYVIQLEQVLVEPGYGLILDQHGNFIKESQKLYYTYPSVLLKLETLRYSYVDLDRAVYFDGYIGGSYYHIFADVLTAFHLIQKYADLDWPFLIGKKIFDTKVFQFLLHHNPLFQKNNWIVIETRTIYRVKKLIITKAAFHSYNWLKAKALFPVPENQTEPFRKIFLTRDKGVGRTLQNPEEVIDFVTQKGYEVVDTEFYTLPSQVKLFSEAKNIIGLHEAGLTNILFSRGKGVKLIEILTKSQVRPHYFWLSGVLGMQYDAVLGGELDKHQLFHLEIDKLAAII